MRTRLLAPTVIFGLAVALAACGGGSSDSSSSDGSGTDQTTTAPSSSDSGSNSGSDSGSKDDIDCAEINTAAQQLLSIQMLAQLSTPDNVAAVKDGTIGNFDAEKFKAGMETLHQLDSYSSPLGDPKEAIDTYEEAAQQAQALFDADPPTQAAIDDYMASIGSTGEFIGHQTAIAGALDEAGC